MDELLREIIDRLDAIDKKLSKTNDQGDSRYPPFDPAGAPKLLEVKDGRITWKKSRKPVIYNAETRMVKLLGSEHLYTDVIYAIEHGCWPVK